MGIHNKAILGEPLAHSSQRASRAIQLLGPRAHVKAAEQISYKSEHPRIPLTLHV